MNPQTISTEIGKLTTARRALQANLPRAKTIIEYDRIAREIENLEYQIEILMLQRDIARMQNAKT